MEKTQKPPQLHLVANDNQSVVSADSFAGSVSALNQTLSDLERFHGVIHVPSYYEIRYAFEHLARAFELADSAATDAAASQMNSARRSLELARINAIRATVEFSHYRLLLVRQRYASELIFRHCPEYFELEDDLKRANDLAGLDAPTLLERRSDLLWLEREYVPQLLIVYRKVSSAEEVAFVPEQASLDKESGYRRIAAVSLCIGVLGLLVGLAGFLL